MCTWHNVDKMLFTFFSFCWNFGFFFGFLFDLLFFCSQHCRNKFKLQASKIYKMHLVNLSLLVLLFWSDVFVYLKQNTAGNLFFF